MLLHPSEKRKADIVLGKMLRLSGWTVPDRWQESYTKSIDALSRRARCYDSAWSTFQDDSNILLATYFNIAALAEDANKPVDTNP